MQIKVESLSKVKKRISFEIPAARVSSEIEKVYDQIRKRAAIKGFRKGKAPQSILEKHYSDMMEEDVLKNLVNDTYFNVLRDERIFPVSHPVIESDALKKGESFKYSATVEVFPEVEVKDYVGLEVKREKYLLDEAVIAKRLQEMQESMAQMKPVDENRAAATGDFVTLDFKGFVDGVPFEHGDAEDFQLELGSGRFIPGFEEQLVGMKVGDEGEVKVIFPTEYGSKELAGKEATFAVKIKELKVKELPSLDDEFAKQFGEFDTLEQLQAKLVEYHEKQQKERIEGDVRERLVKALIERNELEVPEALVERQLHLMLENTKKRLAFQRLTLEMMGLDEKSYLEQFRETAEIQVKGSLLLEALAGQEGITVAEQEIEEKYRQIAAENSQDVAGVKKYYDEHEAARENLVAQLKEDKVVELLLGKAKVTEVAKDEI